jgi:acyl-CoA-binding protein
MGKAEFERALEEVKGLPDQPPDVLLELYGLYKQASLGDVQGKRPGMLDIRGRAKYDAWAALRGLDAASAMDRYVAKVEQLKAAAGQG